MKIKITVWYLAAFSIVCSPTPAQAQGLINGGFELYNPQTQFLVGWHVVAGAAGKDYGTTVNGLAGSLLENNKNNPVGFYASIYGPDPYLAGLPVENFWLYGQGPMTTAEQRFLVPSSTRSLQFRTFNGGRGVGISLEVNGKVLEQYLRAIIEPGGTLGTVSDYAVDMTAYAGQEVDLRFSIKVGSAGFDDVRLSTEVVPEPGTAALGMAGLSLLFLSGRKKTRGASTATHRIPGMSRFIP